MASRISKIWISSRPRMRVRATPWTCCKTILNSMIGRIRPRIQDRPPRVAFRLLSGGRGLWLAMAVCAASLAAAQPPPPAPPPAAATPGTPPPASSQGTPDDDFIEFLGGDDVGDAAWGEFLKKVPPRGEAPPAPPPQDAKQ